VEFLVKRVEDQIRRSADVLHPALLMEYREALRVLQDMAQQAR
jgi:hypothetical protein